MSLEPEPQVPAEALARLRAPFEAFGGAWIDAPVLLPLGLLLDLAGEALRARLLVVQAEGAEDAALRPDFTIPAVQAHLATGAAAGRYLYQGAAFVAPGPGRPAEFVQIGAEVFGKPEDPVADDAAVAALAWTAASAGGRQDLGMTLGDVGLFAAFLSVIGAPDAASARMVRAFAGGRVRGEIARARNAEPRAADSGRLAALLGELPEAEAADVLDELWRLAGIQPVGGRTPAEIARRLAERAQGARAPGFSPAELDRVEAYLEVEGPPAEAFDRLAALAPGFEPAIEPWVRRLKALDAAGAPASALTFSAGLARPFGYYDGMLFEVRSEALGPQAPVAAGGRYDALPARLSGSGRRGAVGCMLRPARAWSGGAK